MSSERWAGWFAVLILCASAAPIAAKDVSNDADLLGFVEGEYAVIRQEPDEGSAYSGSARIEANGGGLVLKERRGTQELTAVGKVEVPSPPGEGKVLRFRWQDGAPMLMTCLVSGDLDNYARLTCYWWREGAEPGRPGLEAMFPTATWPGR